jgi:hypothetical protein
MNPPFERHESWPGYHTAAIDQGAGAAWRATGVAVADQRICPGLRGEDERSLDPEQWRGLNLLAFALMEARRQFRARDAR